MLPVFRSLMFTVPLTAFVVVGLPGIFLALLVRFTLKDPPRGYAEAKGEELPKVKPPPFWSVVKFMLYNPVLRNIVAAGTLISFTGYAAVIWVPIYLDLTYPEKEQVYPLHYYV